MQNEKAKYTGKMNAFYVVITTILDLLSRNIGNFTTFKALYTAAFVNDLQTKLAAAKALPSTAASIADRALARIELKEASEEVRLKWQALKAYIEAAFAEIKWEQELVKAGWNNYLSAGEWDATAGLTDMAIMYIGQNNSTLGANNNMPANFKVDFQNAADAFNNALLKFRTANGTKLDVKNAKIAANNVLYDAIVTISKDAEVVYKKDADTRKQYAYTYQLALQRGGAASFKGYVKDENGMPVAGVSVGTTEGKYEAETNEKGYFNISRIEQGDYVFVFGKMGMETVQLTVTLKPATSKTVRIEMYAMVQLKAA